MILALNKPYGTLSQFTPEPGSRWGTLAAFDLPGRVYPIGRLDADSEGLLLLGDEPRLATHLLDPARGHPRTYAVQVEGVPTASALARLASGLQLGKYTARPCHAALLPTPPDLPPRDPPIRRRLSVPDRWISLELTEGKNRQVRRMTAAVGHPTLRLVRMRIGTWSLDFRVLPPGHWRTLSADEVQQICARPPRALPPGA